MSVDIKEIHIDGVGNNKFKIELNSMIIFVNDKDNFGSTLLEFIEKWSVQLKYIEAYDCSKIKSVGTENSKDNVIILTNFECASKCLIDSIKINNKTQYLLVGSYKDVYRKLRGFKDIQIAEVIRTKKKMYELRYK